MSENRRMNSTARRIARGFLWRTVFTVLLINVLLLASSLALSAYLTERAALGELWQADLERNLTLPEGPVLTERLQGMEYAFSLRGGEVFRVKAYPLLSPIFRVLLPLLFAEALLILLQYRGARRRVMRLMTPLRQMAQTAREFSQAGFDEKKFHTLEDAIDSLSVQSPGATLKTGDSELAGLETAVNNLVSRMHDAYRQQIRFVSDASHELRTPIAVIRGYADLLSRWGKDDKKVMDESVSAIKDEADNMQRLVEQLLYLARGDAGRTPFEPRRVQLDELVRETFDEFQLIKGDFKWRNRSEGSVPAMGDEAMLKQALRVLADNAVKFSQPGSLITLRAFMDAKGRPSMSVQDNGAGIPKEDLPHIFERFFRSDPARVKGGTGLGLSIAKWIADRHGGFFDVISSKNVGTRITLTLPALPEAAESIEKL